MAEEGGDRFEQPGLVAPPCDARVRSDRSARMRGGVRMLSNLEHRNVCRAVAHGERDRRPEPCEELADSIPLVRTGHEVGLEVAGDRGYARDERTVDLLLEQRTSPSVNAPVRTDRQ